MKEERKPELETQTEETSPLNSLPEQETESETKTVSAVADKDAAGNTKRKKSVVVYIFILFAVAFLFLLLAYFMQQRNTAQMLEGLRNSNSAMENIELLQQRNIELDKKVDDLELQVQEYENRIKESEAAKEALEASRKQAEALNLFWQIVKAYESGQLRTCRTLIAQMEEGALISALPSQGEGNAAEEFAAIQKAVTK
ncbi:MAG: hypothetical protein IIY71_02865 [Oscillospiraceae bacterium]|nr:hypothetical protein [Oscillospiraceae bacterium]